MVSTIDLILNETGNHSEKDEHDQTYILTESVWLTKALKGWGEVQKQEDELEG